MTTAPRRAPGAPCALASLILGWLAACITPPNYEGRSCIEEEGCPAPYACGSDHRCRRVCGADDDCSPAEQCTGGRCLASRTLDGAASSSTVTMDAEVDDSGAFPSRPLDAGSPRDAETLEGGLDRGDVGPDGALDALGADASSPDALEPDSAMSDAQSPDGALADAEAADATIDPRTYAHRVVCTAFDDGYTNQTATADAIFISTTGEACIPGGTSGICRRWFGRCVAEPAVDGHSHDVFFSVFDSGYSNLSGHSDSILMSGALSACIPNGTQGGDCRQWFGRGSTSVSEGHSHEVRCETFDDSYSNASGSSDAIFWNGSALCVPGGAMGTCRRWFGLCSTE
jgi:hypothetical protein